MKGGRPRRLGGLISPIAPLLSALACLTGQGAFAAPQPAPGFGPSPPGICVFDRAGAVDHSNIGANAELQLNQLAAGVRSELSAQRNAIQVDDKGLAARKASTPAPQYAQAVAELRRRYGVLERLAGAREQQLKHARAEAALTINQIIDPNLSAVAMRRSCSLVLSRRVVEGGNGSMDITADVIQLMNTHATPLTIRLTSTSTSTIK